MLSDSPRATVNDSLDISGVMAALGLAESQCGIGIELYLAKIGVSSPDKAIAGLTDIAGSLAGRCKLLSELDNDSKMDVLKILATFAYQDYSRSAASVRPCDCCHGSGFIEAEVFTNKVHTPLPNKEFVKASLQMGVNDFRPSEYDVVRSVRDVVRVMCRKCNGKGVLSNSCRCHGKGKVIDKEKTEQQGGVPFWKPCERCDSRGYSRLKFSAVLAGLQTIIDIRKTRAYEEIQPFFELLVDECYKLESGADVALAKVTV